MSDPVRDARDQLKRAGLNGSDPDADLVPDVITRSWRRSISSRVSEDGPAQQTREIDPESILLRAAEPVLDRWQHQLTDTGTTLFVSDRAGSIVARRASDRSAEKSLDRANAAEGFDYSEDVVGTNGLGTAIVEKGPVLIQGAHHYNELLSDITCAAAPLFTPTGSVIGAVSLGGLTRVTNPLMMSVTREIGQQIEERLRASSRPQDLALAMSFMRYTNARRPTIVLDKDSLLANTPGLPYVSVSSHVMLWELLNSRTWTDGHPVRLQLAEARVEVVARRVVEGAHTHFVAHFADLAPDEVSVLDVPVVTRSHRPDGTAVVVVDGPRGSGRATVAHDRHGALRPRRALLEISALPGVAWDQLRRQLDAGDDVLLRRVEELSDVEAGRLGAVVREHRAAVDAGERSSVLFATIYSSDAAGAVRDALAQVDAAERTWPLAESRERIPALVTEILERVDKDRRHTLSPAAMQSLMAWRWPGNVSELVEVLADVVRNVRTSVIERKDLPARLQQAPTGRRLTPMEEAERDAILRALEESQGNRSAAASRLGIGRTTLYRKLRQLGIESGEASL
ncbi:MULTISPECIES: helix-turn-helix domain-containing protein [unclassified Aeromicrobium]|uniref:helix-turn-helix domain-containing protein n=1 Tax=unclassified Aeromicrobium TaxID=2633570 RepID=UPI00396B3168